MSFPSSPASSSFPSGNHHAAAPIPLAAIIGASIGGAIVLFACAWFLTAHIRRRRLSRAAQEAGMRARMAHAFDEGGKYARAPGDEFGVPYESAMREVHGEGEEMSEAGEYRDAEEGEEQRGYEEREEEEAEAVAERKRLRRERDERERFSVPYDPFTNV